MKIYICSSCEKASSPTKTKTTLSGWAQGEDIIKKKRSPQYLLSSQSCVLFSKSAMTFDLENPRWPPSAAILDFKNWLYLCNGSRYRMVFFLNDICTFSSYVIVILVGRTCLAVEEKMNMLNSAFTKKQTIFVLFVLIFLQMYSIVPCSKLYESRFFIFTQFWGENVIKRGTC